MQIRNAVAIANGKGGVGKTTLCANLAGVIPMAGWRILVVDLDRQGNLKYDLGYLTHRGNDGGRALRAALLEGDPLSPSIRDLRRGIDVVCGGEYLAGVAEACDPGALTDALGDMSEDYDLVLLDCPTAGAMIGIVLRSVWGVIVPVRADRASIEGLQVLSNEAKVARRTNPTLAFLGVVRFGVPTAAARLRQELGEDLDRELGGMVPVFETVIRDSSRAGWDLREKGELAIDYAKAARGRTRGDGRVFSSSSEGLANDYRALGREVLRRVLEGLRD